MIIEVSAIKKAGLFVILVIGSMNFPIIIYNTDTNPTKKKSDPSKPKNCTLHLSRQIPISERGRKMD